MGQLPSFVRYGIFPLPISEMIRFADFEECVFCCKFVFVLSQADFGLRVYEN